MPRQSALYLLAYNFYSCTVYRIGGNFHGGKKAIQLEKRWFPRAKFSFSPVACTAILRSGKPRLS